VPFSPLLSLPRYVSQLEYDFQFYKVDILTDVPVVLLSEARSLLPSDMVLPLRQTRDATWAGPPEEELTALLGTDQAAGKNPGKLGRPEFSN
jgi:hypothetical protein